VSETAITVIAHEDQCAGSGGCRKAAPLVFGASPDGWVVVLDRHPQQSQLSDVLEAHDVCPVTAIEVLDAEGESLA